MEVDEDLAIVVAVLLEEEEKQKKKRRIWCHNINRKRLTFGEYHTLFPDLLEDDSKFFEYFRMTHEKFESLLNILEPELLRLDTNFRTSICPRERLAICLRFLATGMSFRAMAFTFRMGNSTIREVVYSTCKSIWKCLQPLVLPEPNEELWKSIERRFYERWNFPNVVGAIDGKHVVIEAPHNSGSDFFCYKKCFSIVLMALVDADKKFIFVDVGAFGKNSDGSIFGNSELGKKLQNGTLQLPPSKCLPGTNVHLPHVIVGDEAFPLRTNIMRPYSRDNVHGKEVEKIFNYRLSRVRNVVENAFGIFVRRFRVFEKIMALSHEHLLSVVLASCLLHNYLREDTCYWTVADMAMTAENAASLAPLKGTGGLSGCEALAVRNIFKDYFNSNVGSVNWQLKRVRIGKQLV